MQLMDGLWVEINDNSAEGSVQPGLRALITVSDRWFVNQLVMLSIRRCATCQHKSDPCTHKKLVACTATTCKYLSPKNLLYKCANWSGNEVVTSVKPKSRQKLVQTITHRAARRQFVCHTASDAGKRDQLRKKAANFKCMLQTRQP